jgi:hypothetical protein
MRRGATAAIAFMMMIGSVSCRKEGGKEVIVAMHAMEDLKTFRMASSSGSTSATFEYVCPDRVHQVVKGDGNESEQIAIGRKIFMRNGSDSAWVQETVPTSRISMNVTACAAVAIQATGGAFGAIASISSERPGEFKYMGREAVDGKTCDSWAIPVESYSVPHPGQYHDPTPHWAAIVCIDPASHRILQTKAENMVLHFYDFNLNITIQEPEASTPAQHGATGSSGSQ